VLPQRDDPLLLTAEQVACLLGISRRSVFQWVRDGLLPRPMKLGASSRWHAPTLRAWALRRATEAAPRGGER
jgi:excisionase family DNA binding protein